MKKDPDINRHKKNCLPPLYRPMIQAAISDSKKITINLSPYIYSSAPTIIRPAYYSLRPWGRMYGGFAEKKSRAAPPARDCAALSELVPLRGIEFSHFRFLDTSCLGKTLHPRLRLGGFCFSGTFFARGLDTFSAGVLLWEYDQPVANPVGREHESATEPRGKTS